MAPRFWFSLLMCRQGPCRADSSAELTQLALRMEGACWPRRWLLASPCHSVAGHPPYLLCAWLCSRWNSAMGLISLVVVSSSSYLQNINS